MLKVPLGKKNSEWRKNKGSFKVLVDYSSKNNIFNDEINDHKILNSAVQLQKEEKNKLVILVSKDINLRLKAKSLNLRAEDYLTGKIQNVNSLDVESQVLENIKDSSIDRLYKNSIVKKTQVFRKKILSENRFYILKSEKKSILTFYDHAEDIFVKVESLGYSALTGTQSVERRHFQTSDHCYDRRYFNHTRTT